MCHNIHRATSSWQGLANARAVLQWPRGCGFMMSISSMRECGALENLLIVYMCCSGANSHACCRLCTLCQQTVCVWCCVHGCQMWPLMRGGQTLSSPLAECDMAGGSAIRSQHISTCSVHAQAAWCNLPVPTGRHVLRLSREVVLAPSSDRHASILGTVATRRLQV